MPGGAHDRVHLTCSCLNVDLPVLASVLSMTMRGVNCVVLAAAVCACHERPEVAQPLRTSGHARLNGLCGRRVFALVLPTMDGVLGARLFPKRSPKQDDW